MVKRAKFFTKIEWIVSSNEKNLWKFKQEIHLYEKDDLFEGIW